MKKITLIFLLSIMIVTLIGCGKKEPSAKSGGDKIKIVCTIFPQYDWVRQIIGDKADRFDVTLLIDSRVDLHSYQPSVQDIAKISGGDMFIYIGGESDEWVGNVLKNKTNPNLVAINLLDALGDAAKTEEVVEGMQKGKHGHDDDDDHDDGTGHKHGHKSDPKHGSGHKHDHGHKKDHHGKEHAKNHKDHDDHDDDGHAHNDEHIWLSLKNARTLGAAIVEAISSLDKDNAETYRSNWEAYAEKLSALDKEYQAVADAAAVKTLLFADRFPFRYLTDDYNLKYYAAFSGCSAETEASFETIVFLAKKADELKLRSVMVTESADQSIAKTVINNTKAKNQQILVLNAMQSVTSGDVKDGATYLSIMESNLNVLKEALK